MNELDFDPMPAARLLLEAHALRADYRNLPEDVAPRTLPEAYAVQDALRTLRTPQLGEVVGLKIATTTKVMQQLMGVPHPCGGLVHAHGVAASPARVDPAAFGHLMLECELAVRLARDLDPGTAPFDRESVKGAINSVLPAFELLDDRKAEYRNMNALSLVADNAWNAGVVLGPETPWTPEIQLDGLACCLTIDDRPPRRGATDDPLGALAWIANLAAERGWPLRAGMFVITGSIIPTVPVAAGSRFRLEIAGLGRVELVAERA